MTFLPTYLSYKKGKPKNTPFFRRKVCQRTSHQPHYFIWAKLLKFQETFLEKFLVSGFGAEVPTFNAHKKRGKIRVFYIAIKTITPAENPAGVIVHKINIKQK